MTSYSKKIYRALFLLFLVTGCTSKTDSISEHLQSGDRLQKAGKPEQAIAEYDLGLALDPKHTDTLMAKGLALEDQNKLNQAIELYERVLSLKPKHVNAHLMLANAYRRVGKLPDAIAQTKIAVELSPGEAWVINLYGKLLDQAGKKAEAQSALEKAVSLTPNDSELREDLARFYEKKGDTFKALAQYKALAELYSGLESRTEQLEQINRKISSLTSE